MIRTCLIALAALGVAACNKDQPAQGNQAFSDDDFTQSAIVANDVTAIDAATGDAANMAADLPLEAVLGNEGQEEESASATTGASEPRSRRPATTRQSRPARPAAESEAASTSPSTETATTNNED
jgi:L-alanine-DL-glutamate epimerase-like enolase superfamily enzyme